MIPGTGGDTSSEGSVTDLAIPHHVPHVLPPPPQMIAPLPPNKRPVRKISGKPRHPPRKTTMVPATSTFYLPLLIYYISNNLFHIQDFYKICITYNICIFIDYKYNTLKSYYVYKFNQFNLINLIIL